MLHILQSLDRLHLAAAELRHYSLGNLRDLATETSEIIQHVQPLLHTLTERDTASDNEAPFQLPGKTLEAPLIRNLLAEQFDMSDNTPSPKDAPAFNEWWV